MKYPNILQMSIRICSYLLPKCEKMTKKFRKHKSPRPKMNQSELVMSIVFDNEEIFKWLTPRQTHILLLTSKASAANKSVQAMRSKHYAMRMYYDMYGMIYEIATTSSTAEKKEHVRLQKQCAKLIKFAANICAKEEAIKDCLSRKIMAAYKEGIYTIMYTEINSTARSVFFLAESALINELGICDVEDHKHDPNHYVFEKDEYYTFCEMDECIMSKYHNWYNGDDSDYSDDSDDM